MRPHEHLRERIERADGPAIVAFLTAGYPEPDRFLDVLEETARACEAVEIGVPFTDPMADGVTIQRSSQAALKRGVSLHWILDQLESRSFDLAAPVLLMSYLNPLLAFGLRPLAQRMTRAGVSGLIVPDLPYEESAPLKSALQPEGLALVQLVTPATPGDRLAKLCSASDGFVYAVTRTGITGGGKGLPAALAEYLRRVKAAADLPVCAGFGVRERHQVELIGAHADGVIVGSALVEALERGDSPGGFIDGLRPPRPESLRP